MIQSRGTVDLIRSRDGSVEIIDFKTEKKPDMNEAEWRARLERYQYGFMVDADRVHEEWLLVYETKRAQRWFERDENVKGGKDPYTFSPLFKGQKEVWKKATRKNALFLSTAVQLNCEALRRLYAWIATELVVMPSGELSHVFSTSRLDEPERRADILSFMNAANFGIQSLEREHSSPPPEAYIRTLLVQGKKSKRCTVNCHDAFDFPDEVENPRA